MSSSTTLRLDLHPAQQEVFRSPHRFNVLLAGRRFGKTDLAIKWALFEALKTSKVTSKGVKDLTDQNVWIVGPTFLQEKRNAWKRLKRMALPVTEQSYENEARIELINGRTLEIKGADDPAGLEGVGLSWVCMDEYAKCKPSAWDISIQPMLTDTEGGALFIGTLRGKNHFWQLAQEAKHTPDWGYYEYPTVANPFISEEEVERRRLTMTSEAFREQYLNKPSTGGGKLLKAEWCQFADEPREGSWCIAVDLAGYADEAKDDLSRYKQLDETAIAIVKVTPDNHWWVKDIRCGRWGVRETATAILKACQDHGVRDPGIEKGALLKAVLPYLNDHMRKIGYFIEPIPLVHGGKAKPDRIMWSVAPRLEHGRMTFARGAGQWFDDLLDEMADFPNARAPDDRLDALAYIDQVAALTGSGLEVSQYARFLDEE